MVNKLVLWLINFFLDYIKCDYCNRNFNTNAAERHINFCREQNSRIKTTSLLSKSRSASSGRHSTTARSSKSIKSTTNSVQSMPMNSQIYSAPKTSAQRSNSQRRQASHERVKTTTSTILSTHPTGITIAGVNVGTDKDKTKTILSLKQTKICDEKKDQKLLNLSTPVAKYVLFFLN